MKNLKKSVKTVLTILTTASLLAGCSSSGAASTSAAGTSAASTERKQMTIAVAVSASDDTVVQMKKAYEETIGPALNIKFIFSEALTDVGAVNTFIENSYAAGANAVYSNVTQSLDQAAAKCNELGMYYVGTSSADSTENSDMPYYVGVVGASSDGYRSAYATAMNAVLKDGKKHSVLIMSGAASYGATSFIEGTVGALNALKDSYGLTYTADVNTLATSKTTVDAENDKGIKITILPGMSDLTTNASPLLQTGDYDILVGTSNIYSQLGVLVDEVEKAMKMDIKFITRAAFSDNIKTAFNTKDSQGSPVLDGIVMNGTYEYVDSIIMLRNAFDGYADNMRDGSRCSRVPGMAPLVVTNATDYNTLSTSDMPYCFMPTEDILALCTKDTTWKDIDAYGAKLTTENILAKFKK